MSEPVSRAGVAAGGDYRADIDGLRAIAVGLVCLFHAGIWPISGGYIGVDVFFVISGFVITRVLIRDAQRGDLSLTAFFIRRIRRLAPALTLLLLVCVALFTLMYPPSYLRLFGESLVAQSLFASNLYFWQTTDYFGAPSEAKPLLHTWSLAVEEQFYIVFAAAIWLCRRWPLPRLFLLLAAGCVLSFVLSIVATPPKPSASFYLLPTRAWELLSGALLAVWFASPTGRTQPHPLVGTVMGWLGLLAIFAAAVFYRESTLFPYFFAALPVGGTVAVIWANTGQQTSTARLLSSPPLVFLGLISYAVYLWHWVALAFVRWMSFGMPPLAARIGALLVAVLLAYISWRWVEKPIRSGRVLRSRLSITLAFVLVTAGFASYGALAARSGGFPGRASAASRLTEQPTRSPREKECFDDRSRGDVKFCVVGDSNAPSVSFLAIGDSHALSMLPALDRLASERHLRGQFAGTSGCLVFVGAIPVRDPAGVERCRLLTERTLQQVRTQGVRHVILLGRWDYYTAVGPDGNFQAVVSASHERPSVAQSRAVFAEQFPETAKTYQDLGATLYVVLQVPHQRVDPESFMFRKSLPAVLGGIGTDVEGTLDFQQHLLDQKFVAEVFHQAHGVQLVDPSPALCPGRGNCLILVGGRSMYFDDDHLSVAGAELVAPSLAPIFARIANDRDRLGKR